MGAVGLLDVGAVLIINGLMLLGYVEARAAAPLNLFVGALQVLTPTYLIFTSGGDADVILAASGIYLFGFTYLDVGINLLAGLDGTGLGWFSAFVAVAAVVYAGLNFFYFTPQDPAFGAIWLTGPCSGPVLGRARTQAGGLDPVHGRGRGGRRCGHRSHPRVPADDGEWADNVNRWARGARRGRGACRCSC